MTVLRTVSDLKKFLSAADSSQGFLADTGFLYAVAFDDDRLYDSANEVLDLLADQKNSSFCECDYRYVDQKLMNEWTMVEEDLGLNFIEIMEGQVSDHFDSPLAWSDMVQVMGERGLRGPDAMIANLFAKSNFPLLITNDSDFEKCFSDTFDKGDDKAIFLL